MKALAELLQRAKGPPARLGRPPGSGSKLGRMLPEQTKRGPEAGDTVKATLSPTLPPQTGKSPNSIASSRPRGRPRGSFTKRPRATPAPPCQSVDAPCSLPESEPKSPSPSPRQAVSPSPPPPEPKKPPLILKFFSKARRHKSGKLVVTHVRLKGSGHRRGRKRKWSVVQKKRSSPLPSLSVSESEAPLSESEGSAPEQEQKEAAAAAPESQPEVPDAGPELQPELPAPKPEAQPEVVAPEPGQQSEAPPPGVEISQPELEVPAPGDSAPASPNGLSGKQGQQQASLQSDGTGAFPEERSSGIALSTRAQCSKRGRGRPPLTASQRAQRAATQQLPAKPREEALTAAQLASSPGSEEAPALKATFLKNIRQFIMPVVSARSSRLIRTPRRFIDEIPQKTVKPTESPAALEGPCPVKQEASLSSLPVTSLQLTPPTPSSPSRDTSRGLSPPPSPSIPHVASSTSALPEKRRSILREPTFRWTSLSPTSSPKDLGKTLFHLPSEDSPSLPSTPALTPSPPAKRTPLLRAPQFTPSEAHLKIYESLTVPSEEAEPLHASPEVRRDTSVLQQEAPVLPSEPVVTRSSKRLMGRTNHLTLPLFTESPRPLGAQGRELITMEDVNSPGVVHKVAIRRVLPPVVDTKEEADSSESEAEPASPCSEELPPPPEEPKPVIAQLSSMDKVYSLLTRAKVQLFKIDQQKNFKLDPVRAPCCSG